MYAYKLMILLHLTTEVLVVSIGVLENSSDLWNTWLLKEDEEVPIPQSAPLSKRITPKSVFIAPSFNKCPEGYRIDTMGQCVKVIRIHEMTNEATQWFSVLQKLNLMYSNVSGNNDNVATNGNKYKENQESETNTENINDQFFSENKDNLIGPLQLSIPFSKNISEKQSENSENVIEITTIKYDEISMLNFFEKTEISPTKLIEEESTTYSEFTSNLATEQQSFFPDTTDNKLPTTTEITPFFDSIHKNFSPKYFNKNINTDNNIHPNETKTENILNYLHTYTNYPLNKLIKIDNLKNTNNQSTVYTDFENKTTLNHVEVDKNYKINHDFNSYNSSDNTTSINNSNPSTNRNNNISNNYKSSYNISKINDNNINNSIVENNPKLPSNTKLKTKCDFPYLNNDCNFKLGVSSTEKMFYFSNRKSIIRFPDLSSEYVQFPVQEPATRFGDISFKNKNLDNQFWRNSQYSQFLQIWPDKGSFTYNTASNINK